MSAALILIILLSAVALVAILGSGLALALLERHDAGVELEPNRGYPTEESET